MKFGRRLRLYIFGVLIGSVLVFFFFEGRLKSLTNWMPNNRVLYRLQESPSTISDKALCQLNCFDLDTSAVRIIKTTGDVDFTNSQTKSEPMVYLIEETINSDLIQMEFEVRDSSNTLTNVRMPEIAGRCECP